MSRNNEITKADLSLNFHQNMYYEYSNMKKNKFNEVRDSYNNDFKSEKPNENKEEVLAKDGVQSYTGSSKYMRRDLKNYNNPSSNNHQYNAFVDYNEVAENYDRNKSILYDQKAKVFPNTVVERMKKFYDGTVDMSKEKNIPKILVPVKDEVLKYLESDRANLNQIDISYMTASTKDHSKHQKTNRSNNKSAMSPSLDRSLIDKSQFDNRHNQYSLMENSYGTQLVPIQEGNRVVDDEDEDFFKTGRLSYQTSQYLQQDELGEEPYEEGIDIGLFKGKVPMDYETLTKVCQLINNFSKSKGQVDHIKKLTDPLYKKLDSNATNDQNVGSNRIAIKRKYNQDKQQTNNTKLKLIDKKDSTYYEKLEKMQRMKIYTNQNKYLNKLSNTTRKFKGFVIEQLNEDGIEDYEYHLY